MRDYFYFAGKSSADFGVYITDAGVYNSAKRSYETVAIPGRNGNILFENNRYDNVELEYPAILMDDFDANYTALTAFLHSQRGYQKLSDSFHPDEYYMDTLTDSDGLQHNVYAKAGTSQLKYDTKPQRYLKKGDNTVKFTAAGSIKNPTLFEALPLIRAYGTGTFTISGVTIQITSASTYTDIDCELQEAFKGSTNCNGNIVLTNGVFPSFKAGVNDISMSGVTSLEIKPRWWKI